MDRTETQLEGVAATGENERPDHVLDADGPTASVPGNGASGLCGAIRAIVSAIVPPNTVAISRCSAFSSTLPPCASSSSSTTVAVMALERMA